jgi:type II secretory pathway pseudopilin PulG
MKKWNQRANGFSMIELLFAAFIFTVIAGTVFSLLLSSQVRYQADSSLTAAFQQANVAIDQITRDIHSAGYPPASSLMVATANSDPSRFAVPFAWSPGYPGTTCTLPTSCTIPGDYDLILEADVGNNQGVQWIRYSLNGTTLMRGMTRKRPFADPVASTAGALVPYLDNVMNGNNSVKIFDYTMDPSLPPSAPFDPSTIREVNIRLIVQSSQADPQTGQFRSVTLTGQAVRFNPSN